MLVVIKETVVKEATLMVEEMHHKEINMLHGKVVKWMKL